VETPFAQESLYCNKTKTTGIASGFLIVLTNQSPKSITRTYCRYKLSANTSSFQKLQGNKAGANKKTPRKEREKRGTKKRFGKGKCHRANKKERPPCAKGAPA